MISARQGRHGGRLTDDLDGRDGRAENEDGARDEEDVFEDAREREDKAGADADEKDGRDVQQERDRGVAQQDERANLPCCGISIDTSSVKRGISPDMMA